MAKCKDLPRSPRNRLKGNRKFSGFPSNRNLSQDIGELPSREYTSCSEMSQSPDSDDSSPYDVGACVSHPLDRFLNGTMTGCGSEDATISTPQKNRTSPCRSTNFQTYFSHGEWDTQLSEASAPESVYSSPPFVRIRAEAELCERIGRRILKNKGNARAIEGSSLETKTTYSLADCLDKSERVSPEKTDNKKALNNSFNSYHSTAIKNLDQSVATVEQRIARQARYSRPKINTDIVNTVRIHIYDLLEHATIMRVWNTCDCPLGKVFQAVNNGLHCLGSGAYHAGLEVNGIEYSYGYCPVEGVTGVFTCLPKRAPGHQYRTTIDFGKVKTMRKMTMMLPVDISVSTSPNPKSTASSTMKSPKSVTSFLDLEMNAETEEYSSSSMIKGKLVDKEVEIAVNGNIVMSELADVFLGTDYDILRNNCCHFVKEACISVGIPEENIPTWFMVGFTFEIFNLNRLRSWFRLR
uniref:PPPDE domain-containing protein n=1 Tax=Corethron hystrix TaxID=216773 RepID=A0A7S1C0D0_9STRA|mmetsp:Transcript_7442/g.16110  ORF Transcript_7442/g.16110 Transcript_7442/m.16110 type:complete len:466 (+) Transcript_7442:138-1535(+)